ncbi:MAG TPA: CoA transferase [Trebonia sp.]|jgi:2-methylfumaryl-CoA isomerase|nr:CoA transferase [Trebonia sp.]
MDSTPRLPLAGLQVVECASYVAGPTGGLTLAQLGAEVVRIDPVGGGNDYRRWPLAPNGESYYWSSLNKGKRSVAIDLRSDEGRELAVALMTAPGPDRGLLIDNVVGRAWLAHDTLKARRKDLIHLRVQGRSDGGPAVDYTVNAAVGVPQITGPEGAGTSAAAPVNHVLPAWDLITGVSVAAGMLAALHDRERTGQGAFIELALADVALAGVSNLGWLSEAELRGADRPRHGNHLYGSFASDFATRDGGRVMVVALTHGQWKALQTATGTAEVFEALETALGVDLKAEEERYQNRETIAAILRPWFQGRDLDQATAELDAARVLWGPYRGMADVAAAYRRGAHPVLADLELGDNGPSITARSPLRWNGRYGQPGNAPVLGRDTDQVLTDVLGLAAPELSGLHDRGVIQ